MEKDEEQTIGALIERARESGVIPSGVQMGETGGSDVSVYRRPEPGEIARILELVTLDQLSVNHMSAGQARLFTSLLEHVRAWRADVERRPGLSFVLSGIRNGTGKSTVARAVADSFAYVVYANMDTDGKPLIERYAPVSSVTLERRALFWKEGDLLERLADRGLNLETIIPAGHRAIVIDDVGRSGNLQFERRDPEEQAREKRARWLRFLDYAIERRVSVFVTTNFRPSELYHSLGTSATSRLRAIVPEKYVVTMPSAIPDYRETVGIV